MLILFFDRPLVFWFGVLALIFFVIQIILGILMTKGYPNLFKYHKINAVILSIIVLLHVIYALILYI